MAETGTCLPLLDVIEVAQAVIPDAARRVIAQGALGRAGLGVLIKRIHDAMGTRWGEEEGWLARLQPSLSQKLSNRFRPARPAAWTDNPRLWLSSVDIAQVLQQYETSHGKSHAFRFVGVFPRDFARQSIYGRCVADEMCQLSVRSMRSQGRARFGIVFNMDESHQPGSHWMACFGCIDPADRRRFGVYYYDSVGRAPPAEILAFMRRLHAEAGAEFPGRSFVIDWNRTRRQFKNTECGIYAIYFIVACLTTRTPYRSICDTMGNDDALHRLRDVFFRDPAPSGAAGPRATPSPAAVLGGARLKNLTACNKRSKRR
jgi:hypothetical protein